MLNWQSIKGHQLAIISQKQGPPGRHNLSNWKELLVRAGIVYEGAEESIKKQKVPRIGLLKVKVQIKGIPICQKCLPAARETIQWEPMILGQKEAINKPHIISQIDSLFKCISRSWRQLSNPTCLEFDLSSRTSTVWIRDQEYTTFGVEGNNPYLAKSEIITLNETYKCKDKPKAQAEGMMAQQG